jgi:putative colanic acid biosynthesis UDP-glucose lipid carrier transferase
MTGWAQVNGFRGETNEPELMEKRLAYDLGYIENWTILFDLRILFLTIKAVAKPENAY